MTLDTFDQFPFGKYNGQIVGTVIEEDPSYKPLGESHLGRKLTEWEWVEFVQSHFEKVAYKMAAVHR